jgi:glutathione S-transferase
MKVHDIANFPNPLRVRIALAEKNATNNVEFVDVDVMGGEHRTDEFKLKNPSASVPVLELEDGTCISESAAIIDYIDNRFEGPSLTGVTAEQKAIISMYQRRAEAMVLDAIGTYFHHATDGLGPELETYQNKSWGEHKHEVALKGLEYFNNRLENREFVATDDFSAADITLYAGLIFAGFASIEIPASHTHLLAWRDRVEARPSVKGE